MTKIICSLLPPSYPATPLSHAVPFLVKEHPLTLYHSPGRYRPNAFPLPNYISPNILISPSISSIYRAVLGHLSKTFEFLASHPPMVCRKLRVASMTSIGSSSSAVPDPASALFPFLLQPAASLAFPSPLPSPSTESPSPPSCPSLSSLLRRRARHPFFPLLICSACEEAAIKRRTSEGGARRK